MALPHIISPTCKCIFFLHLHKCLILMANSFIDWALSFSLFLPDFGSFSSLKLDDSFKIFHGNLIFSFSDFHSFFSSHFNNNLRRPTEKKQWGGGGGGNIKALSDESKIQHLLLALPLFLINYTSCVPQLVPLVKGYLSKKQTGNTVLLVRRKEMVVNWAQSLWATGKNQLQEDSYFITSWQGIQSMLSTTYTSIKHCTRC